MMLAGVPAESGDTYEVRSPYDGRVVAAVHRATKEQAAQSIDRAEAAFQESRRLSSFERHRILSRASELIHEREDELARTIALEAGKPIRYALGEARRAVITFLTAAEESKRMYGELLPLDVSKPSMDRMGITQRFPRGVILGISPFNFPLNLVSHKVAPAIASGNVIVLKPASQTPLSALLLAEILGEAGLPEGMLSVLPMPGRRAQELLEDPRIKMLTFTGSAEVGWNLRTLAGKRKVVLELGGNAGVIVHKDSDLDLALPRCLMGAFAYSGQVCISVQRIFVHESVYDPFVARFVEMTRDQNIGDPLDENTDVGPMITEADAVRTEEWIREAEMAGASVLTGGKRDVSVVEPTVIADVTREMKVYSEEAFAPLVTVSPFSDFDDALARVNDSRFGLQAGVFTKDLDLAFRAFEELDVGGVILNDVPTFRVDPMPYGGVKDSGTGREGIRYAMESMTDRKLLVLRKPGDA
jgi:glyceraldehyde-3-phosphate dehydrogenase (NADP+)